MKYMKCPIRVLRGMKSGHEVHEVPEQLWIHDYSLGIQINLHSQFLGNFRNLNNVLETRNQYRIL